MICYASRTGTRRNLAALQRAGWRLLISRAGVWRTEGFPYALDNGAWTDFQQERLFDEALFAAFVERFAWDADWVVAPDIVAGGARSLALTVRWLPRLARYGRLVLIAVQDGMSPPDLRGLVGPRIGIFLGGTTPWKLQTMEQWGAFAHAEGCHYHVARVNTEKRMALANAAGAASVDGSSASRFAVNVAGLTRAAAHGDLFSPLNGVSQET